LIANIQTTMDNVATVCEQILGVLTWREPRVTFVTAVCFFLFMYGQLY
jgi:hypothetical protein